MPSEITNSEFVLQCDAVFLKQTQLHTSYRIVFVSFFRCAIFSGPNPSSTPMWLTDLLRKLTRGPNVGETFRDYIGCYLFGTEVTNSNQPEYIAAPTSVATLEIEVRNYLQDFLNTQHTTPSSKVQDVQALLAQLPEKLLVHTAGDMQHPFFTMDGMELFIRKGVRQRRKENGQFVE